MSELPHTEPRAPSDAFVYGTLQVPAVLLRVLGRVPAMLSAELHGFVRGHVRGQTYPAIVPRAGSSVSGAVLLSVQASEWRLLDAYEGELYDPTEVTVTIMGQTRPARCYVLRAQSAGLFDPAPWSLEKFIQADLKAYLDELS